MQIYPFSLQKEGFIASPPPWTGCFPLPFQASPAFRRASLMVCSGWR